MKEIRIKFVDFYHAWDPQDNLFVDILSRRYDVKVVDKNPNYLFHSVSGGFFYEGLEHFTYRDENCIKIFFTGENIVPDFNFTDYAMSFQYLEFGDRYLRLPLWYLRLVEWQLHKTWKKIAPDEALNRPGFCNYVYSNSLHASPTRGDFFRLLSEYKPVDAAGRDQKNTDALERMEAESGATGKTKLEFLSRYKFTIAFENESHPGYATEKIVDAFAARTVPIYWGSPRIAEEFDPASFINAHDFDSLEALADEVRRIDQDDDAYMAMLNTNPLPAAFSDRDPIEEKLDAFFRKIFDPPIDQAYRRPRHGTGKLMQDAKVGWAAKQIRKAERKRVSKLKFWKR